MGYLQVLLNKLQQENYSKKDQVRNVYKLFAQMEVL
jgi:hypothetical protein